MTESIVLQVCRDLKIHPSEFFGPGRDRRLSRARHIAIQRLKRAGFNNAAVARLMKRNYSTIQYWLQPGTRIRRSEYYSKYRAARKQNAGNVGVFICVDTPNNAEMRA